ncbi:Multidrug resistance protein CDR1 [Colletotrichum chlorophyti]|uniref:Multidrug resistance protein CDR1 n=1 Tax=Colletotrichum chlorophyti TaxID=708187 RepID=A0A1Q8RMU5_9PEZI|nr:Multidrug resistance protein CDR1 [Colletotrichum chlorophyti]
MRSDSETETESQSGVLPNPTTNTEEKGQLPGLASLTTASVAEKEWSRHDEADAQEARMNDEVQQLARRYTSQSLGALGSLFPVPAEGPFNPDSPDFNARQWAKAFYNIRIDSSEGNPPRTTGIAFKNLNVFGFGSATDYQKTVGNVFLEVGTLAKKLLGAKEQRIDILHDLEGVVHSGEMLAVLGPPGSGCSTLLRTIAGDTHGFHISKDATINYQGIHPREMRTAFRGEAIYTAEVDDHFAHLTVGDTLYFAARARCPKTIPEGVTRKEYAEHLRDVTMAMFGISHTKNTRVGDDFVRGVSGGERKRVTIAEAALSYSPLQCWDNSTRGLDSANALEFCRTLRLQADVMGCTSCVAIYQASQDAYDRLIIRKIFDKVIVLFEGRQIFFGKTDEAKAYFEGLGFVCPEQQTTADFLTSMTSHQERIIRPGWEGQTPRSPDEFSQAWKASQHRVRLLDAVEDYLQRHPFGGDHYQKFLESRRIDQSNSQRQKSPFTLSYVGQMKLTLWRSWVMLRSDPSITITMLITNVFQGLIISSLFYNLPSDTSSLFRRSTLLFFMVIVNAFGSILEIMTLYAKRRVIEKHARYALYHPSAEALSAMIVDLPYKIVNTIFLNTILYFMGNLRRAPGPFFFFLLISFVMLLTMSMMFRLIGSVTKSIAQALAPASIVLLMIALYTGFAIPPQYMQSWLGWIRWINPVFYGLESVFLNEFFGRNFPCSAYVPSGPGYDNVASNNRVCSAVASQPEQDFVSGTTYVLSSYGFVNSHRWRNLGVMIAYMALFMGLHLFATEYVASERSKGEVLVFSRSAMSKHRKHGVADDEAGIKGKATPQQGSSDSMEGVSGMEEQTSIFHWKDVCYDIKIKSEPRRILDNVDGWVKPGTLTALMGVSGAGKTTLLDVLATRVTMGVISGEMLVNGQPRDGSFQRKTGYVTQQDLHLHTSTVREALNFSALLRQPEKYTKQEKLDYVDTVITLLGMEEYSDAVIGVPGEGLNVEQRKRLTIGVELAARPELLLFLDEPTSGLDSQTSWSICNLMEKLTRSGQAILCTIHQPSAMLFQRFDRLLLLARGGRTVYFGEIGQNSQVLVDYFVRNGGPACPAGANPAEWMLEVIGAAPGAHTEIDWPAVWRQTPEYQAVQDELSRLRGEGLARVQSTRSEKGSSFNEFAAGFNVQFMQVTRRVFQQYWRSPTYIYSKGLLSFGAVQALFIGLSFLNLENTQRGLQSQMFGVFIFITIFSQIVEQILPVFISQRTMYEARERPSKAYSWKAFLLANILVEMAWNSLAAVLCYICWYYPIGLYRNAYPTNAVDSRGITMFLHVWVFFIFAGSFAHMMIAGLPNAEIAGGLVNLLSIMMFLFCGILAGPGVLPGFWIFMYRVNPFTYAVEGFLGTSLANAPVHCASNEYVSFTAPNDQTCGDYLANYISVAGGYLSDLNATDCQYCSISDTNTFLRSINVDFGNRWRNFGFMWVYCIFNICAAALIYWLVRMPKNSRVKKE